MPKALITKGPFAVVRHPLYVAYSLAWLGAPIATHGPLVSLFAVIAIATYVAAARREERLLEARFGEAYRVYKRGTGMIVPSMSRLLAARSVR